MPNAATTDQPPTINAIPDILEKIVTTKHQEVAAAKLIHNVADLTALIATQTAPRGFAQALISRINRQHPAVIAEIKQASPSKGILRHPFYPAAIAKSYEQGGAACLSVLTDTLYFQGSTAYLKEARAACQLPVLRKDFIIDEYQIYEARAMGADAILLIAACLSLPTMQAFEQLALSLGMDVLVEVHDATELNQALQLTTPLLGINNRNLKTFDVSLNTTLGLLSQVPQDKYVVTESGIHTPIDVALMQQQGVYGFLVGEALMRQADPQIALTTLFFN